MLSGERDREANSFGVEASLLVMHSRRQGSGTADVLALIPEFFKSPRAL